jgi:hypothetical protein
MRALYVVEHRPTSRLVKNSNRLVLTSPLVSTHLDRIVSVVDRKTAKALGVTIPPALLLRVDRAIE